MDRIENCGDSSHTYESLAWACIGICGSAIMAAAALPFSVDFVRSIPPNSTQANIPAIATEMAFIFISISSMILAFFSFRFASQHAKDRSDIRRIIVEDMQSHADRHPVYLNQDRAAAQS